MGEPVTINQAQIQAWPNGKTQQAKTGEDIQILLFLVEWKIVK